MCIRDRGCGAKESKDDSKNNGTNVTSTENSSEKQEVGQLILSGSSTLAPVVNEIITNFTETHKTWSSVDSTYGDEKIDIVVAEGGSGAAIKGLLDDTSNFGLVSRPVKEEEKASLEGYGEYNLGTDALTLSLIHIYSTILDTIFIAFIGLVQICGSSS